MHASLNASLLAAILIGSFSWAAEEKTLTHGTAVVKYSAISEEYAKAIARTVSAARTIAQEKFGYKMPLQIRVSVSVDPKGSVRLFNDGADYFSLSLRSENDLQRPSVSGVFHLYGLCHEVAHLAMYVPIKDHAWMTTAAAEGWAHYLGSRLVDEVFQQEGANLWPDQYDYGQDGTARLKRQLTRDEAGSPTVRGAALWQKLHEILSDKGIATLFDEWSRARVDPVNPNEALEAGLSKSSQAEKCQAWWKTASPVLVSKRTSSGFATKTARSEQLTGKPIELANDDGKSAGKQSLAGSGHGVQFQGTADNLYLTGVKIHGARYGAPQPPKEDFVVTLCDEKLNVISTFKLPYSSFSRGELKWVSVSVKPTLVPRTFAVFVEFNPTAKKGVFVSYDAAVDNQSYSGLPGKKPRSATKGDWLIRAEVDTTSETDALRSTEK